VLIPLRVLEWSTKVDTKVISVLYHGHIDDEHNDVLGVVIYDVFDPPWPNLIDIPVSDMDVGAWMNYCDAIIHGGQGVLQTWLQRIALPIIQFRIAP
jgi:hypothetical protein